MDDFVRRLRDRKLVQWALAYVAVACRAALRGVTAQEGIRQVSAGRGRDEKRRAEAR
jgi:hypothetical protein